MIDDKGFNDTALRLVALGTLVSSVLVAGTCG